MRADATITAQIKKDQKNPIAEITNPAPKRTAPNSRITPPNGRQTIPMAQAMRPGASRRLGSLRSPNLPAHQRLAVVVMPKTSSALAAEKTPDSVTARGRKVRTTPGGHRRRRKQDEDAPQGTPSESSEEAGPALFPLFPRRCGETDPGDHTEPQQWGEAPEQEDDTEAEFPHQPEPQRITEYGRQRDGDTQKAQCFPPAMGRGELDDHG